MGLNKKGYVVPKVAFVILHFGDATVTKRCIESLDNLIDSDSISIIVVDNELTKPAESRTCRATFSDKMINAAIIFASKKMAVFRMQIIRAMVMRATFSKPILSL